MTKNKTWKDIAVVLNISSSASAAFNVRKKYVSLGVFHYECKYDLNGVDPLPIITEMERIAEKNKKPSSSSNKNANASLLAQTHQSDSNSQSSLNCPQPSTPTNPGSNPGSAKKSKKSKEANNASSVSKPNVNSSTNPAMIPNAANPIQSASPSVQPPHQHQMGQQQPSQQMMNANQSHVGPYPHYNEFGQPVNPNNGVPQYANSQYGGYQAYAGQPGLRPQPYGQPQLPQVPVNTSNGVMVATPTQQQPQQQQQPHQYQPYGQQQSVLTAAPAPTPFQPQQIQRVYNPAAAAPVPTGSFGKHRMKTIYFYIFEHLFWLVYQL